MSLLYSVITGLVSILFIALGLVASLILLKMGLKALNADLKI